MKILFYDVDTEDDFMNPNGALYVKEAETLVENISYLTKFSTTHKIRIFSSVDAHDKDSKELTSNGGLFLDHCMKKTPGQKKIKESLQDIYTIINQKADTHYINCQVQTIFEKDHYDIFDKDSGNQNIEYYLNEFQPDRVIVYGVATDFCVLAAVKGLVKRGYKVYLLTDCIKGAFPESTEAALKEMKKICTFITLEDINGLCKDN